MKKLSHIRNEKGVALITVVLLFVILVTLLGAAMFAAVVNQRNSILAKDHTEAYYVAESGINMRVSQLTDFLKDPGGYGDFDPRNESMLEFLTSLVDDLNALALLTFGNGNTANVTIEGPFDYPDFLDSQIFIITSTGTVNGVSRTLQQELIITVTFGDASPIDKAVVSRGSVIMRSGNGIVKGAILTNGEPLTLTYGSRMGAVGPVFELGDVDTVKDIDGWCDNITDYGWPEDRQPNLNNIILNGEVLGDSKINGDTSKLKNNNCFKNTTYYNEPPKVFPPVVVPPFPLNPYPVSVVNGKITLPDLRRTPGNYNGYIINGDLTITSPITIELGTFGYSTQLKKIIVNGNFITSSQGTLNVTGNGRLVIMKDFTAATTPRTQQGTYEVQWNANVNPAGNDPTKVIFMFDTSTGNLPSYNNEGHVTSSSTSGFVMTFTIANQAIFNASLLSENVNYNWANAQIKGYIITNGDLIKITSGASTVATIPVWIYAPIGHVSLESNMTLYGSVLAKAVEFSAAQSMVEYTEMPDYITPVFNYLFYAQPTGGDGQAPSEANIFFSNIVEIDNE